MIRDPSDGSVREERRAEKPSGARAVHIPTSEPGMTSGLAPDNSNRAERLKTSREWLKDYHEQKGK